MAAGMFNATAVTRSIEELLFWAVLNNSNGVQACLDFGIQIDQEAPLQWYLSDEIVQINALHLAACYSSRGVIELLLQRGANVNAKGHLGRSAMHTSVFEGNLDCVETFLRYGADVNTQDNSGMTAFEAAILQKDTAMVRLLLEWNVKFLYRQSDEMGWRFWVESGSEIESILENEDAKVKAFAMGMHTLVGDKSCVNYIDDDLLRLILGKN